MLKLFLSLLLACSLNVSAKNIVDVYGVDAQEANRLLKKYANKVSQLEVLLFAELKQEGKRKSDKRLEALLLEKKLLLETIKKEGNFLYVGFDRVIYPGKPEQYITIEIVPKNKSERLRFLDKNEGLGALIGKRSDVIAKMQQFVNDELHLILLGQSKETEWICPAYHCISSFNRKETKPYLRLFNQAAINEKKLIIESLKHDNDPQRRAAAAFLVGHFINPQEIISLLEKQVNDNDVTVRNNVMRVIASVMRKANITHIDVNPFLHCLDSPQETDRNKALAILSAVAKNNPEKQIIIQQGGERLLQLLRLKQPNNHDLAYEILRKLSGKDFGNDLTQWKRWLLMAKRQATTL